MKRRVVITGIGAVTPLGRDMETTWKQVLCGASGIRRIANHDVEGFGCQIAGEVQDFQPDDWVNPRESPYMDKDIPFACAAAGMALNDSGLLESPVGRDRVGCNISTAAGGLNLLTRGYQALSEKGPRRVSPLLVPFMIPDMPASYVSMQHGLTGPTHGIVSACASSANAIGDAFLMIAYGRADAMVTGGTENIVPTMLASFIAARAVTNSGNEHPERASRPFDRSRDGFVMSEGAASLILEEREQALARNAPIYGEILGYGAASDAYHLSNPHPQGEGAERAMHDAMREAGIAPRQIGYINAHGTSTPIGDAIESAAIQRIFGDQIPVSSTKSSTGHLLGAAGALEAVLCLLVMRDSIIPPTINLQEPDPDCTLDLVPNVMRPASVQYALSNSFGFGGHCVSLLFGAHSVARQAAC
jgi:3-oxoacyl-[acyl-carrier-protein] synthase II